MLKKIINFIETKKAFKIVVLKNFELPSTAYNPAKCNVCSFWVDTNGNRWDSEKFSAIEAAKASESLYLCINCTDCIDCTNCIDCVNCVKCGGCRECVDCDNSTKWKGETGLSSQWYGHPSCK